MFLESHLKEPTIRRNQYKTSLFRSNTVGALLLLTTNRWLNHQLKTTEEETEMPVKSSRRGSWYTL